MSDPDEKEKPPSAPQPKRPISIPSTYEPDQGDRQTGIRVPEKKEDEFVPVPTG